MEDILTFTLSPEDSQDGIGTRWLSNFAPSKVILDEIEYPNVEQAYQASKNNSKQWRSYCAAVKYPQTTKKLAHRDVLIYRADWDDKLRVKIMRSLLMQKFSQELYRQRLLLTETAHLEDGNFYGGYFWGTDIKTRKGKNILGELLMDIRNELRKVNEKKRNITEQNF